jgi:hypothetical protein
MAHYQRPWLFASRDMSKEIAYGFLNFAVVKGHRGILFHSISYSNAFMHHMHDNRHGNCPYQLNDSDDHYHFHRDGLRLKGYFDSHSVGLSPSVMIRK